MAQASEHPMQALMEYVPPAAFEKVAQYLHRYKVHLTITRERKSILGDYRNANSGKNHRISVNGNLNKYSFLLTLLHEIAHLLAFEQYGNRIYAHGREWKKIYSSMLDDFSSTKIFPPDIEYAVRQSLQNPAASSCAEEGLMRVLKKYDVHKPHHFFIEQLQQGERFMTTDGRIFEKGAKLRKRFKCREVQTGRDYLFSPIYEVEKVAR